MKHTILLIIFLFLNISCDNKSDKQNKIMIQESSVPLEKQITYSIELNMKLPYELYINDIKADYDYIGANSSVEMNPYLLKNGVAKIKIKIFPAFKANKKLIPLDDLKNSTISFGQYIMDKSKKDLHSYNTDDFKLLNYNLPKEAVPYFVQEWEIEIKELPYELEGWSKGQDLSKMDQKELEKRVTGYYENLWTILNDGNFDKWKILTNERFREYSVYNYFSLKSIKENMNNNEKDIREYAKNTMIPLENFEMKIYAYGKIVTLEKSIHTNEFNNQKPLDIYSWSPLISKGKISGAADYPVLLYLPQNSNDFVIIRK